MSARAFYFCFPLFIIFIATLSIEAANKLKIQYPWIKPFTVVSWSLALIIATGFAYLQRHDRKPIKIRVIWSTVICIVASLVMFILSR